MRISTLWLTIWSQVISPSLISFEISKNRYGNLKVKFVVISKLITFAVELRAPQHQNGEQEEGDTVPEGAWADLRHQGSLKGRPWRRHGSLLVLCIRGPWHRWGRRRWAEVQTAQWHSVLHKVVRYLQVQESPQGAACDLVDYIPGTVERGEGELLQRVHQEDQHAGLSFWSRVFPIYRDRGGHYWRSLLPQRWATRGHWWRRRRAKLNGRGPQKAR